MKENKITVSQEIKKHLLTGISWMIPLIVAAGICIALGQVLGGTDVGEKTGTIPWMLNQIGGWGMGLIVPLISAAIAYSIADRPGFARPDCRLSVGKSIPDLLAVCWVVSWWATPFCYLNAISACRSRCKDSCQSWCCRY